MAEYKHKKYYWLKLDEDFFKRHDTKIIMKMPNGYEYIVFYQQLLCESLDHDGKLRFNELIPYDANMLAIVTDHNVDIVKSAIQIFIDCGLAEIWDDKTLYMTKVQAMTGSQTEGARKKQLQRGGQKVDNCPPEIRDKREEIRDKNKLNKISFLKNGENEIVENFVENAITIDDVQDYILATGREVNVNHIWITTNGLTEYKGQPIYDWRGLVDNWAETEIAVPFVD